jgi:hypothetical protein
MLSSGWMITWMLSSGWMIWLKYDLMITSMLSSGWMITLSSGLFIIIIYYLLLLLLKTSRTRVQPQISLLKVPNIDLDSSLLLYLDRSSFIIIYQCIHRYAHINELLYFILNVVSSEQGGSTIVRIVGYGLGQCSGRYFLNSKSSSCTEYIFLSGQ